MIDTIFFDWGGVIADDPGDEFLSQLLRDAGANEAEVETIYNSYMRSFMRGEISEAEYWQMLRTKYDLAISDSISDEFTRWHGLVVNDAILQLADAAKAKGLKTAILSNVIEPTYNALAATGHFERFDTVIASCKVGFAKPQAEIYSLALQTMHTTPEKSLFIDDKPRNLEPAIKMGFNTILAQNPQQIIDETNRWLV